MTETRLRLVELKSETGFDIAPDAEARAALAEALGILAIRKLRFAGKLVPDGPRDWRLDASLGATVVQACVATLAPVTTRIDTQVTRLYVADAPPAPEGAEVEMPEDDTIEPLPATLDLSQVMAEALALELPPWPRADGVEPLEISVTEPGKSPMTDAEAKPFSVLSGLKEKLEKKGD